MSLQVHEVMLSKYSFTFDRSRNNQSKFNIKFTFQFCQFLYELQSIFKTVGKCRVDKKYVFNIQNTNDRIDLYLLNEIESK